MVQIKIMIKKQAACFERVSDYACILIYASTISFASIQIYWN